MGKMSRDKGARREREVADLMGARKVSRMYQAGPDLLWRDRWVEVKARKDGFRQFYKWLQDDATIVAHRGDRQPWLVTMTLDDFLDLTE